MHGLQFFEFREQLFGGAGIMPVAFQFLDDLALPADMCVGLKNMPFRLLEMLR